MYRYFFVVISLICSTATIAKDDNHEFSASILVDGDFLVNKDTDTYYDEAELRQFKLRYKQDINKHLKTKISINLSDKDISISDMYVQYKKNIFETTFGRQREAFGFENRISTSNQLLIESSLITESLAPGRNIGLNTQVQTSFFTFDLGLFNIENDDEVEQLTYRYSNEKAITTRVNIDLPYNLHYFNIGTSFSYRDTNNNAYDFKSTAEVHTGLDLINTEKYDTASLLLKGLDVTFLYKRFIVSGEYINQQQQLAKSPINYTQDGFSFTSSLFLTQDRHTIRNGKLKEFTPNKTAGLELVTRYSSMNIESASTTEQLQILTLGTNFYIKQHLKFMLNYSLISSDNRLGRITDYQSLMARGQYTF